MVGSVQLFLLKFIVLCFIVLQLTSYCSLLLAFLSCFTMMYFVRPCIPSSVETSVDHGHFLFIQVASVVLGIYVLMTTILGDTFSFSQEVSFAFLLVMVILLMAPLAIPLKLTLYPLSHSKPGIHSKIIDSSDDLIEVERNVDKTEPFLTPSTSTANLASFHDRKIYVTKLSALNKLFRWETGESLLLAVGEGAVKKRRPRRGDDFKFTEALVKADFWLPFMVYFVGVGSGVTVLNNLAQIGIAQGVHNTTLLLSIFSFGNFVGRLEALSEYFVRIYSLKDKNNPTNCMDDIYSLPQQLTAPSSLRLHYLASATAYSSLS